ncbi:hypothetical protein ACFOSW_17250 [Paenibacillus sp. GCM10012303]
MKQVIVAHDAGFFQIHVKMDVAGRPLRLDGHDDSPNLLIQLERGHSQMLRLR